MAKKPENANAAVAAAEVASAAAIAPASVTEQSTSSAPAIGDASAGTQEVGGSATSSTGDEAASPERTMFAAATAVLIPPFQDEDGKVRNLTAEDVFAVEITKNVKIDGVFLEAGTMPLVPHDVYRMLDDLDAVED